MGESDAELLAEPLRAVAEVPAGAVHQADAQGTSEAAAATNAQLHGICLPRERAAVLDTQRSIGRIGHDGKAGPLPQGHDLAIALKEFFDNLKHTVLHRLSAKDAEELPVQTKDDESGAPKPKPELPAIEEWFALDAATVQLANLSAPYLLASAKQAATDLAPKLGMGIAFDVTDKNLPKAIEALALKFSKSTLDTTTKQLDDVRDTLKTELEQGLVEGDTRQELTKRVQEVFADKSKAETIAQTETSRALHTAELMTAKESGVVQAKQWLASADCCDVCEEFAAMDPIPLDQSFGDDDYGPIDGPPGHPRCQCSLTYQLKDLSDTTEE